MEKEPRIPVSLHEYFPKDFFQQCATVACHMVEVEMEEPLKGKVIATEGGKTLTLEEEDAKSTASGLGKFRRPQSARKQERRLEASAT
ncbi:hypothetical protein FF1_013553 [Malus domestica]